MLGEATVRARSAVAMVLGGAAAAVGLVLAAAPATAQIVRIEDDTGVVHYTNEPCQPKYLRLDPRACPTPEPPAAAPATALTWAEEIATTASRHGVDRRLVEAVVQVESAGNPRAVSAKGARGLMQLMPERAAALGVTDVFDPTANLDGGVRHLRELLARYRGDVRLALAAYNAGEDAVRAHGGVPPFPETQDYVRKVLSLYGPAVPASTPPPPRASRRL